MAYPSGRGCPVGHPARIPKLILHITFGIHDGRGFTLASDIVMAMTNAVSLHFDFWNTWNQTALEHEVDAGLECDLED